ncbi:MAG: GntR family transcriptional regulator [Clostridiales bacterium]|nr:MAG: GntR family transcriptional regulator [Clostridiales bacterium]
MISNTIAKRKSMPDIIAEELKEAILTGKFKEGQALKQEEIAAMFETSLIPVREALRTLEVQGLVEFKINKGAFVSNLSVDEVKEIFEIRTMLESGAIEIAAENITGEDIEKAEAILDGMDNETDGKSLSRLNWKFHSIIYEASNRKKLIQMIAPLHANVERYMMLYLVDMKYHSTSQSEHRLILEACKNKNGKLASDILKAHLGLASEHLIEYLKRR